MYPWAITFKKNDDEKEENSLGHRQLKKMVASQMKGSTKTSLEGKDEKKSLIDGL